MAASHDPGRQLPNIPGGRLDVRQTGCVRRPPQSGRRSPPALGCALPSSWHPCQSGRAGSRRLAKMCLRGSEAWRGVCGGTRLLPRGRWWTPPTAGVLGVCLVRFLVETGGDKSAAASPWALRSRNCSRLRCDDVQALIACTARLSSRLTPAVPRQPAAIRKAKRRRATLRPPHAASNGYRAALPAGRAALFQPSTRTPLLRNERIPE